jgi:hypothetical protein
MPAERALTGKPGVLETPFQLSKGTDRGSVRGVPLRDLACQGDGEAKSVLQVAELRVPDNAFNIHLIESKKEPRKRLEKTGVDVILAQRIEK